MTTNYIINYDTIIFDGELDYELLANYKKVIFSSYQLHI